MLLHPIARYFELIDTDFIRPCYKQSFSGPIEIKYFQIIYKVREEYSHGDALSEKSIIKG